MSDTKYLVRLGIKIPLRDGVRLHATLYLPQESDGPAACVFTLTPYIADTYHERGAYFAGRGIPFLIIDVRGRGNSEGQFHPLIQEASDGYDVVEWIASQSYCNGKVGMWGGSYSGYNQWATAKETPPHLATIVPAAAAWPGIDFPKRNNIFYPYVMQWLVFTAGRSSQANIFLDQAYWAGAFHRWYVSGAAFRRLDSEVHSQCDDFQQWIAHPDLDSYWESFNPTAAEYAKLRLPVLTITGIYDDDQPGALEHYRRHLASAGSQANHYLIIGPWDHSGTRTPKAEVGGLQFGSESLLDLANLHWEWYAWTMGRGPQPSFLPRRVAYYVTGKERWRYVDELDNATSHSIALFLDSKGEACDVFASGSLGPEPGCGSADKFVFDPGELTGPEGEVLRRLPGSSLVDQGLVLALRGKCLVYHSDPLRHAIEITGFFRLVAWISIDCPDTDLYVSVHEITSEGTSVLLASDACRARYREGPGLQKLIRTTRPLEYEFRSFTFVSRQLCEGSRLRLVIAPVGRLIEAAFVQKNYNTGGVIVDEEAKDARPVTVCLHHDQTYPSAIHIPLGRPEGSDEQSSVRLRFSPRLP